MSATRLFELLCCAALISIAAALGWAAAGTPPSAFDPIGSGRIPLVLAGLLLGLASALMLKSAAFGEDLDEPEASASPWRGLGVGILTMIFVTALDWGRLPFLPLSAGYLLLLGLLLSMPQPRIGRGLRLMGVALVLPTVLTYLFTHVLYIRLP